MAIIETTRNAKGEFVAKYVLKDSLHEQCESFLRSMRKGFARLQLLLLVLGVVLTIGGSLVIIQVVWK